MTYDFSKAQTADIRTLVDRVKAALVANPTSENAADWKAYIEAGEAELNAREIAPVLIIGGLAVLLMLGAN